MWTGCSPWPSVRACPTAAARGTSPTKCGGHRPGARAAGAGDDEVRIGEVVAAYVHGGAGRDHLQAAGGSALDGGDGADVLEGVRAQADYAARTLGVRVTLDGRADDGAPGEGDNVTTRDVVATNRSDVLV